MMDSYKACFPVVRVLDAYMPLELVILRWRGAA